MFRRNANSTEKSTPDSASTDPSTDAEATDGAIANRPSSKGRPTPSRKEAEAAARARAKPARSRKELAARDRAKRAEHQKKVRAAMKSGDETYLPTRDKGPVKRLVRDVVDTRFGFTELVLPLMVISLILQYSGSPNLQSTGTLLFLMLFILVILDVLWIRFRVRREVAKRFPDHNLKGLLFYAISRSMQIKPWRLPKARMKIGQPLPETYR